MIKRFLALLLILVLLLPALAAQADTWYVYTSNGKTLNLRDEYTNKVIGHIPYGTALVPDSSKSTELAAYVTYNGVSGFVKWSFLQKTKPKPFKGAATTAKAPKVTPTPKPVHAGVLYQTGGSNEEDRRPGSFELNAVGAYIQFADARGRGDGDKYETVFITPSDSVVITVDVPRGKKLDYWVINGTRYDFNETVRYIRLTQIDEDYQFEAVYTKSESETLIDYDTIQYTRTGETLLVQTVRAQLCHLTRKDYGAGGWMESFDFTDDYINKATGEKEDGGRITTRVRALTLKNKRVKGWKFNAAELYPNITIPQFVVRNLNVSITYEPIYANKATATPGKVTRRPGDSAW